MMMTSGFAIYSRTIMGVSHIHTFAYQAYGLIASLTTMKPSTSSARQMTARNTTNGGRNEYGLHHQMHEQPRQSAILQYSAAERIEPNPNSFPDERTINEYYLHFQRPLLYSSLWGYWWRDGRRVNDSDDYATVHEFIIIPKWYWYRKDLRSILQNWQYRVFPRHQIHVWV